MALVLAPRFSQLAPAIVLNIQFKLDIVTLLSQKEKKKKH